MPFDVAQARAQFPALTSDASYSAPIFLDNPAGTQVPQRVIEAVSHYFRHDNANSGGAFPTSQRTDAMRWAARQTLAAFLNAQRPEEIVFGANMTTLTLHVSRAIGLTLQAGDEIILTQMDHDANVNPWLLLAKDHHLTVRWVRLDPETGQLDLATYQAALNANTKWVCVGHAANALGTVNPIQQMAQMAHQVGAKIYVDAVQSAPHLLIDVQALDVDILVCSAYKFFGPHVGVLYGKYDLLEALTPYKVRPAHDETPDKWETGTASFETIAGAAAAVEYLASFGQGGTLRERLADSFSQIMAYENGLTWQLIEGLKRIPGMELRGIVEPSQAAWRVPTVICRPAKYDPWEVAQRLAQAGIYVWSGHYYAVETMRALNHEHDGGMVRIGIAHYNTAQEIGQVLNVLQDL
jgi:cysteine desulfurase family protein (TIGR01976 family)